jgi:hypothetical protein
VPLVLPFDQVPSEEAKVKLTGAYKGAARPIKLPNWRHNIAIKAKIATFLTVLLPTFSSFKKARVNKSEASRRHYITRRFESSLRNWTFGLNLVCEM